MISTTRAASSLAAIALSFAAAACGGGDTTADTAAGTVGSTAAATAAPDADRVDDRVEVALGTDATLHPFGLDADEDDGKVVLKGAVRTEDQRALAAQVATRVASGVAIDNRIRVDGNAKMSDNPVDVDDVEEQVEKAFDDDATLKPFNIDVDEDNGQLVLEGTVKTADQKAMAEQVAKRIAGTVTVVNKIKVQ
jgi:osmotically-inducible protein OsmY